MIYKYLFAMFFLAALTIGVGYHNNGGDLDTFNLALDNASNTISETFYNNSLINRTNSSVYESSLVKITYKFADFVSTLGLEGMRAGSTFGYENPEYFSPDFLILLMYLMLAALLLLILYKPLTYLLIIIVLGIVTLWNKYFEFRKKLMKDINIYGDKE